MNPQDQLAPAPKPEQPVTQQPAVTNVTGQAPAQPPQQLPSQPVTVGQQFSAVPAGGGVPRSKKKLLIILLSVFGAVVLIAGAWFGYKTVFNQEKAVAKAADRYINAMLDGDIDTIKEVTGDDEINEGEVTRYSDNIKKYIKGEPERLSINVAKRDGKSHGIVIHKFELADGDEKATIYSTEFLEKRKGKWLVVNNKLGVDQPKDKVADYPTAQFAKSISNTSRSDAAGDTERKTDINYMHSRLEEFFNENGYYPSLDDVNDSSFRSTYMPNLDNEALSDPEGTGDTYAQSPGQYTYSYSPTLESGGGCVAKSEQCFDYVLTATLSSGELYSKKSLNAAY